MKKLNNYMAIAIDEGKVFKTKKSFEKRIEEVLDIYIEKLNIQSHCFIPISENSKKMVPLDYEDDNKKYLFLDVNTGQEIECKDYSDYKTKLSNYINEQRKDYLENQIIPWSSQELELEDGTKTWVPYK
tara:strand:- start:283 stop:669 length:387 start_codon:yes stop_codon:yes gene_type:complete